MGYFVRPVDRELMPKGKDWLLLRQDDGDAHFFIAADAGAIELPKCELETIIMRIAEHVDLELRVVA